MQANDLLKYRDEIINAFENGTFLSEHLKKKSDDAVNNYVSDVVNKYIEEIKSMEEKINQLVMEKCLLILKIQIRTKNFIEEMKNRISDLKDRIKKK